MGAVLAFMGKVLLIILYIILFLILLVGLVLFVPIRYRAYVEKREDTEVKLRVSWLLRIIHVSFVYKDGEPQYKIRLFGIDVIKTANIFKRKKKKGSSGHSSTEHKEDDGKIYSENTYENNSSGKLIQEKALDKKSANKEAVDKRSTVSEDVGKKIIDQTNIGDEDTYERITDERNIGDKDTYEKIAGERNIGDKDTYERIADERNIGDEDTYERIADERNIGDEDTYERIAGERNIGDEDTYEKIADKKFTDDEIGEGNFNKRGKGIIYKLKEIAGFIKKCINTLKKTKDKLSELKNKVSDVKNKASIIKEFIFSEYVKGIICIVHGNVIKLLKKIKPRKLKSDIILGLGDPCLTGEVLGGISVFMAVTGIVVNITPDFEKQILEGRIEVAGKIRVFTLIRMGLSIIISKEWKSFYREAMRIKEEL